MSDIFISYASEDRARAKVLAGAFERQGWSVWWDREILPGGQFSQIIEEEIGNAKCVIVLWSETSVGSKWVRNEAREGARREILVPALIDDVEIPLEFSGTEDARLVDWRGRSPHPEFNRLLKAVSAIVGQPSLPKQSEPTPDEQQPENEIHTLTNAHSKEPKKRQTTNVFVSICSVTLITIISIGIFLKYRQPKDGNIETNSIDMKLVYIPAGSFMMGSSFSATQLAREYDIEEGRFTDEFPQHQVRISKGFWMGQTEVTQNQYKSVMNAQPWYGQGLVQEDASNPAVYVTWDAAADFCRKLSLQEGKTYRLPTEAEWEYVCRAGTTTRFSFGDRDSSLDDYAWFNGNADKMGQRYAHPVGQKKLNPWGLYDMHGNVLEWCSDWYNEDYYSNSSIVDPKGPLSGASRSLRGGSWNYDGSLLRCAKRFLENPSNHNSFIGFRVVRSQ